MMFFILLAVIGLDQVTKSMAEVGGRVSLNPGISFGWLAAWPSPVLSVSLLGLVVVSWAIYKHIWERVPIAAGLFLGGAISNIIDRVYWSGVRDWLPIPGTTMHNNLADYAIGFGLILMVIHYFKHGEGNQHLQGSKEIVVDSAEREDASQSQESP